jgi:L-amino acid N-acyltransferase YncA
MIFRNATREDLPKIVEIYNTTVASRIVTADTEPVSVESRVRWFDEHNSTSRPLWMIEDEGKIIGWASFQSFYGRPAYNATVEVSIYLDPSQRGKGYGKKVLQHVMEEAPALEVKTLLGFIFAHNEPSLRLFEGFGFKPWANFPNIAVLDGIERSLIILGKRVAD